MSDTLDRFTQLLVRYEIILDNLNVADRGLILVAAALAIPPGTTFTEKDITERLARWLTTVGGNVRTDPVELRRLLVDSRCVERDPAGRAYTRAAIWPVAWVECVSDLESLDLESFAERVRAEERDRRGERKRAALEKRGRGKERGD